MLEFPTDTRNINPQLLHPPNYDHTISGTPQIQLQNFSAQVQGKDNSVFSQQPLQYDRFQSSFPTEILHIHHNVVVEEESLEKVFMKVNNPHLVDDDHVEYDVTLISNLPEHGFLGHSLTVQKRYNDFYDLYHKVGEIIGDVAFRKVMPEFPGIIWYNFGIFGFNLDLDVIRERQIKFNYLMIFIAKDRFLRVHQVVDDFFGISRMKAIYLT